jgi:cytochrome c biogenesis protein ResB
MVVKNDPGQPVVWVAFGSLISGLVLTFYFPRRRAWARIEGREVRLAFLADRYVDAGREFGQLVEAVGAATEAARPGAPHPSSQVAAVPSHQTD